MSTLNLRQLKFVLPALLTTVLVFTTAQAQTTIYSHAFGGGGGLLDGVAVDSGSGVSSNWIANSAFLDNGSTNGTLSGSALLNVTLQPNAVYNLGVDITVNALGGDWGGLGFAAGDAATFIGAAGADGGNDDRFTDGPGGISWALLRDIDGATNAGDIEFFAGPGAGNGVNADDTFDIAAGTTYQAQVILTTAADGASFTSELLINGTSVLNGDGGLGTATTVLSPIASIGSVGLTFNNTLDPGHTFDNFVLTEQILGGAANQWDIDGGGSFNVAGNWTSGVPAPGSTAVFGAALVTPENAPAVVTLPSATTLGGVQFSNALSYELAGPSTLTLNGTAEVGAASGVHEISARVAGSNGLTKTGAGVLTLSNATNSYTGNTSVSGGTLQVTSLGALNQASGATSIATGATLQFGGDGAGGGATGALTEAVSGEGAIRLATSLTTEIITAGTANSSYTGVIGIGGGTLRVTNAAALGTADAGITIDGGDTTGKLELAGVSVGTEPITIAARTATNQAVALSSTGTSSIDGPIVAEVGGSEYNIESQSGTLTLAGNITTPDDVASPGERNINLSGAGNGRITGAIVDLTVGAGDGAEIANVNVRKTGSGTWTIATSTESSEDFHRGVTTIEAGTLAVASAGGTAGELWSSDTQVRSGATFDVTSFTTYSMQEGGLALSGAGTVNGNTLEIFSDNSLNPGDDGVGTLNVNGNVAMSNFGTGGLWNYELGNATTVGGSENDLVAISGSLTGSSLVATVSVSPVEGNLATGTYRLMTHNSASAPAVSGLLRQVVDNSGNVLNPRQTLTVSSTTTQVNLAVAGSAESLTWNGAAGNNTWDAATSNNWTGGATSFRDLDDVTFGAGGIKDIAVNSVVSPGSVVFDGGAGSTYSLEGSGGITGFGPVSVNSGTVVLNNFGNNYAGSTTIASGARVEMTNNASVGAMEVNGTFALPNNTQITTVDNFDTPGLGEYSFSKVLDQGTATNVSFSDTGGTINVTSTGADGAEQVLLLRNDVTLAQGQELQLDAPTTFMDRDFGLAVGQSHADLGNGSTGDNRTTGDYLFIAWRNLGQLNGRGFNGNADSGLEQEFGVNAEKLFIARTANDDIELGWYDNGTRMVSHTVTPATLDIFSNLGFYADVRADGNGFSGADNLRIVTGSGANAINVDGDFDLASSGTLQIDLSEIGFASLNISGDATLDGLIDIDLVGGFAPGEGQAFTILTANNILTGLGDITFDLPANFSADIVDMTSLVLTFNPVTVLFGDADNDLAVAGSDLLAVTNNFGSTGPADGLLLGDADDDGAVAGSDLLAVTNNFGATAGAGALADGNSAVPEPMSWVMLLGGASLLTVVSRRQSLRD